MPVCLIQLFAIPDYRPAGFIAKSNRLIYPNNSTLYYFSQPMFYRKIGILNCSENQNSISARGT